MRLPVPPLPRWVIWSSGCPVEAGLSINVRACGRGELWVGGAVGEGGPRAAGLPPGLGYLGRVRRRVLIALGVFVLLLCMLELGLRVWARSAHRVRGMAYDEVVGWRPVPGVAKRGAMWGDEELARTNSHGWRTGEVSWEKPPGVRRVVVLGDSFSFGIGVDDGKRYSEVLERALADVEVINLAVNAWGTDQELRALEVFGLRYEPDVVVLAVFPGNDLRDIREVRNGYWPKPYYVLAEDGLRLVPPRESWDVWLRTSSYLGEGAFALVRPFLAYEQLAPEWESADSMPLLLALVERAHEVAREGGAQLLVLLIHPVEKAARDMNSPEARIARGLGERGIAVFDTWSALRPSVEAGADLYLPNAHWNAEGHRLVGAALAAHLRGLGWLE